MFLIRFLDLKMVIIATIFIPVHGMEIFVITSVAPGTYKCNDENIMIVILRR